MRKNKILSVIGGLAAFIFTSCDGIFDVDYYTFLPEDYIFTNESTIEEGLLGCYELLIRIVSEEVRGGYVLI